VARFTVVPVLSPRRLPALAVAVAAAALAAPAATSI